MYRGVLNDHEAILLSVKIFENAILEMSRVSVSSLQSHLLRRRKEEEEDPKGPL